MELVLNLLAHLETFVSSSEAGPMLLPPLAIDERVWISKMPRRIVDRPCRIEIERPLQELRSQCRLSDESVALVTSS